jgi:hypothetical protein
MPQRIREKLQFLAGLFLVCMCVLMLQIVETRILSVISFYHLAFFAISIAMFGMTAGSLIVYFNPMFFAPERLTPISSGSRRPLRPLSYCRR